jgi:hypothetical protein
MVHNSWVLAATCAVAGRIGRPSDPLVWLTMPAELERRLSAGVGRVRGVH